jgi:hypothetical protein
MRVRRIATLLFVVESEARLHVLDGLGSTFAGLGSSKSVQESLSVFRRAKEMHRLDQTAKLIGGE